MTKNNPTYWKFKSCGYILIALYLLTAEVCISDEANAVALQEARVAREASERKVVQLEIELEQSRKALEKMRSRYADLYLRSHGLIRSLRQTELQVANLWHNKSDSSTDALASRLLEALSSAGSRQLEVVKALDRYEESLKTLMEVLQPSESIRRELTERFQAVRNAVERSVRPLTLASGQGAGVNVRQGCRVVSVDNELDMVLLEGGRISGMTSESVWALTVGGQVKAKFIVVEVRLELSAAVLLEGSLADVPVGGLLLPVEGVR